MPSKMSWICQCHTEYDLEAAPMITVFLRGTSPKPCKTPNRNEYNEPQVAESWPFDWREGASCKIEASWSLARLVQALLRSRVGMPRMGDLKLLLWDRCPNGLPLDGTWRDNAECCFGCKEFVWA